MTYKIHFRKEKKTIDFKDIVVKLDHKTFEVDDLI